jgi:hypothetical protein
MTRLAVLLVSVLLSPFAAWAGSPITLKVATIDLPDPAEQFAGPGSDAMNANCLACHSSDMVLNQPNLSRASWEAEVNKMIRIFKAPVATEDVATIVDYLAATKGVK